MYFFYDFLKTVHVLKVFEGLYEVSWSTEFNNKETGFVLSTILKKKKGKTVKNVQFFLYLFDGQVSFFQERYIEMSSDFWRCNRCIKTLHLSYQTVLIDDIKFSLL